MLDLYAESASDDYWSVVRDLCTALPGWIRVPDLLRYRMYYKNYGHREDARSFTRPCRPSGRCPLVRSAAHAASLPQPAGDHGEASRGRTGFWHSGRVPAAKSSRLHG